MLTYRLSSTNRFGLFTVNLVCATLILSGMKLPAENISKIYIGTYTSAESKGVYMADFNQDSGELSHLRLAAETVNPSFLAWHPTHETLYAVNETGEFKGEPGGGLSAFKVDGETGRLTLLNQENTGGGTPCHLVVDAMGKHVLVANYSGGNVSVFRTSSNGGLEKRTDFKQHKGSSVHPRQTEPHAHGIYLSKDQKVGFVPDLGLDKIIMYQFNTSTGSLGSPAQPWVSTAPGAGPRHLAFHPTEHWAYSINELNNTVTAFDYDPTNGSLKVVGDYPTLPTDFKGTSYTAEVVMSPNGRFLYGSNRGHDSIVVFRVNPRNGSLKLVEYEPTQGKAPRNFAVDPSGKWLLAANQSSGSVVAFSIHPQTGALNPTGSVLKVPSPVCVLF